MIAVIFNPKYMKHTFFDSSFGESDEWADCRWDLFSDVFVFLLDVISVVLVGLGFEGDEIKQSETK